MNNVFKFFLTFFVFFSLPGYAIEDTKISDAQSTGSAITPSENTSETMAVSMIDELKTKAANGDIEAQLNLGYMYLYGINGVNIDYKQALSYYEAAAAQKSAVAYNNLGSLYFSGVGTEVDKEKALHFFEEAAKLGSNDAAVNLAIISLSSGASDKTDADYKKIFDLLNQAQKDNNIAKFLLGYAYANGFHVEQNKIKAFKNVKAAADDKYDEAQYILADFYIRGFGTAKNYNRAIEYLQMAADQGNIDAMMQLADILSEGKIYTKDIKKAHMLYNVASVSGAKGAAEKRDALEANLPIQDLLSIQAMAEDFTAAPSQQTTFIRQTFGNSLKAYIDAYINNKNNEDKKGE